jgi:hypothetical protein
MKTTKYYDDFLQYFSKAKLLEEGKHPVGDPLMDTVPIYDCVHRRCAGFSNVLEDIMRKGKMHLMRGKTFKETLTVFLIHRLTGSGASFEHDHGYRNSCIFDMLESCQNSSEWVDFLITYKKPMFTTLGNQTPLFPKPEPPYKKGSQVYFTKYLEPIVSDFADFLDLLGQSSICDAVDFCLDWHKRNGIKRFLFVLTAFVIDVAEYFPEKVNPDSDVYLGKNSIEALELIFGHRFKSQKLHDVAIRHLIKATGSVNTPYDMEDVVCDYIRYVENYLPKKGYEEHKESLLNNSLVKDHPKGRQFSDILGSIVNHGS